MVKWWVIGNADKTQFVSWSCGSMDTLEHAAVYRSLENAEKKIKQLLRNLGGWEYQKLGLQPVEIEVRV